MSPANKFWLGVLVLVFLLLLIKNPCLLLGIIILWFIVSSVFYIFVIDEGTSADNYLLAKYSPIHLSITLIRKFNNFLNNKFSKNGKI